MIPACPEPETTQEFGMRSILILVALAALVAVALAGPAAAQTDFYNLDKDRPLRVEDAYATKRYAFELQVAPLTYPRFNGLIWAYHWLQVAVHEPLLAYDTAEERQAAMQALLARFWQMLENPPEALPSEMPMTAAIAPLFTERFPRFAAVFDNLHMMHDVISDILVSNEVADKRREIYRQADLFRDPDAMAVTREEWIAMAIGHGLDAQGGPALGILHRPAPTDTVPAQHPMRGLILDLLEDEHVLHRIHAVPELHEAWQDDAVQRHIEMMRRMHADVPPEALRDEQVHDHRPLPPPDVERGAMRDEPGMHQAMQFVLWLLDDPHVQHRIHAVPEYHAAWEDADFQAHLTRMRRMHGGGHEHH
jgi:hypothetical protein